jgi:SAM-dependent methyltransferase
MNDFQEQFYPESGFGGFTDIDGMVVFYSRVNALLQPSFNVVDFGCGRGKYAEDPIPFRRYLRVLKERVSTVIGVDVDEVGRTNPTIDEFRLLEPGRPWPFDDRSMDMIICNSVMEHLPDPEVFFQEAKRILVAGGYLCILTPNIHSYFGIASRFIPNRYHSKILARVQSTRKQEDTFPTLYRCNTISAMRRHFKRAQFRAVVYGYESEPSYLSFSKLAYAVGVCHQKFAPGCFKLAIFAFGQSLGS